VRAPIAILGEAKATNQPPTTGDLAHVERIRALLAERGRDVSDAMLVVFSRSGHDPDLVRAATRRDDVRLVGLPVLYDTTSDVVTGTP
jgi:hypothetical protein